MFIPVVLAILTRNKKQKPNQKQFVLGQVYTVRKIVRVRDYFLFVSNINWLRPAYRQTSVQAVSCLK